MASFTTHLFSHLSLVCATHTMKWHPSQPTFFHICPLYVRATHFHKKWHPSQSTFCPHLSLVCATHTMKWHPSQPTFFHICPLYVRATHFHKKWHPSQSTFCPHLSLVCATHFHKRMAYLMAHLLSSDAHNRADMRRSHRHTLRSTLVLTAFHVSICTDVTAPVWPCGVCCRLC